MNKTISTGPTLVTNASLAEILENEQTTMIPLNDQTGYVGAAGKKKQERRKWVNYSFLSKQYPTLPGIHSTRL